MNFASEMLIQNDCEVETLLCPNLAHGVDNEGLLIATRFLQKYLNSVKMN